MNFIEFQKNVEDVKRNHPFWFDAESDCPAENDQILRAEQELGAKLPIEYHEFVKQYGGGYFAFTNIFSVQADSEWYIVDRNKENETDDAFIAISDDEAGGYYGFLLDTGVCGSEIFYWDHESKDILKEPLFNDLFLFIAETGLKT